MPDTALSLLTLGQGNKYIYKIIIFINWLKYCRCSGREGDAAIFSTSTLAAALKRNQLNLPKPCYLPDYVFPILMPYFIVPDEAFPLLKYLMRPYPGRTTGVLPLDKKVYNYRYFISLI